MRKLLFIFCAMIVGLTASADVMTDFDGLGDNKELLDKAKALNPEVRVNVVQERVVNRRNRFEIAPELSKVTGGDNYINTYGYGLNLHYHINPWVSVGVRGTYFTNKLTKEGENLITDVDANGQGIIPDIDQPKTSYMGFANVYPIYGKFNFMNMGITHFDLYGTAGYGRMNLKSGSTGTWTAGGGVGLWWSKHFTTRLEVRYQNYSAQRYTGSDSLNTVVGSIQMGVLL
jgi:outer membrane beta-barrel protein